MNKNVLRKLSYGVYVVATLNGGTPTGCIANSVMQITHNTIALSINHTNFTNECLKKSNKLSLSILGENSNPLIIGTFGFKSGRDTKKFKNTDYFEVEELPVIKDSCGYLICDVINSVETETHTVFIAEIKDGDTLKEDIPMTYAYYQKILKGKSPKAAPTYIAPDKNEPQKEEPELQYRCTVCGYIYHGDITKEPDDYVCPICGQPKEVFEKI